MTALLLVAGSSLLLGAPLTHWIRRGLDTSGKRLLFAEGAGLAIWCVILFILGHVRLLSGTIFIVISGMSLVNLPLLYTMLKERRVAESEIAISWIEWGLVATEALIALLELGSCFAPVTGGITNDEIDLHLSVPSEWLRHGGITQIPYPPSYLAGNGELLFCLAEPFETGSGPRLISWLSYLLCIGGVYVLARRFFTARRAILAAALAGMNPLLFRGASIAFVDNIATMFMLMSVWMMLLYRDLRGRRFLALASLFIGVGCGTKPTQFLYGGALFVMITVLVFRENRALLSKVKRLLLIASLSSVIAFPWAIRTYLLTGSPTFPPPLSLMNSDQQKPLLGASVPYSKHEIERFYAYCYSRYGDYRRSIVNFVKFPWDITYDYKTFQIGDSIGTVLLSLLPLAFGMVLFRRERWTVLLSAYAGLSGALVYFLLLPEARYFIGVYCILCVVLPVVFNVKGMRFYKWCLAAVIGLNLVYALAIATRINYQSIRTVFDKQYRALFQARNTPYFEGFAQITRRHEYPVVVMRYMPLLYYFHHDYILDTEAIAHYRRYCGMYLIDFDRSQLPGRALDSLHGTYLIARDASPDIKCVSETPDMRIYHFVKRGR